MIHTATDTTISLITCYPGSDIYELEGHSALRVSISDGRDYAINYGLFDFSSPNFVYRFVKGETDYRCGAIPTASFLRHYSEDGRKVVEQRLNLTPAQKARAIDLIATDLLPENATYRYNYVKDNCATRPLSVIEKAIVSPINFNSVHNETTTFRDQMRVFHANYPWYQFGIDLALGSGIDYNISQRETAFAPVTLSRLIENATYTDEAGQEIPLVANTTVLAEGYRQGATLPPTPYWQTPMAFALAVLALTVFASVKQIRGKNIVPKITDTLVFGMQGMAGLLLTFLIFISVHEATSPNFLYVWLNPLAFAGCMLVWLKSCKKALLCYHFINFALLAALATGWWLIPQSGNTAFIPLITASALRSACQIYTSIYSRRHKSSQQK